MPVRIGDLRHKVWIQTKAETRDDYSAISESWVNDTEVWAGIWPIKGTEYQLTRQAKSALSHKIIMRFTTLKDGTRISHENRIYYQDKKLGIDRYFEIEAPIDPDERHEMLTLMCTEKT